MSIPKTFLYDWIANGTGAEIRDYIHPDIDMETAVNQLRAGLSSKHLAADAIGTTQITDGSVTSDKIASEAVTGAKIPAAAFPIFTSFSGVDGSGVDPALGCALTGALVGDKVIGLIDFATGASAADKFESVITVDDEIQQTALEDLSANTYVVLVLAGS